MGGPTGGHGGQTHGHRDDSPGGDYTPTYDDFMVRLTQSIPAIEALTADIPTVEEEITATDQTGTVWVVLAPDGLPRSIHIGADWRRNLGAEGVAAAVTEACAQAIDRHGSLVDDALVSRNWGDRFSNLLGFLAGVRPPPDDAGPPPQTPAGPGAPGPEPIMEQLAETSTALTEERARRGTTALSGAGAAGRATLTLGPDGAFTCEADADWVRRNEAPDLERALAAALADLRAQHEAAEAHRRRLGTDQDELAAMLRGGI